MTQSVSAVLYQHEVEYINSSKSTLEELAKRFSVSTRTISRVKSGQLIGRPNEVFNDDEIRMSAQLQKTRERAAKDRKVSREVFRMADVVTSMQEELIQVISESSITKLPTIKHTNEGKYVGVIQLSDLHFGEVVSEVNGNQFNLTVASKRLMKLASRSIVYFKAMGVTEVVLAMTGDLVNSDRRLDELASNANNRAKIVYTAVEILSKMIYDINREFNVTVSSVCGNESRINKDLGWIDFMAFDNFDAVIHMFLEFIFKDKDGVTIVPMQDPLECVLNIAGKNLLLIHGHNGLATDGRILSMVSRTQARYSMQGVRIDYIICGHIHESKIADMYARSASLVGGNAYSDKGLNLTSRAAQNIYLFSEDGIEGIKIDLQEYASFVGYEFDGKNDVYKETEQKANIIIQKVIK